MTPDALRDALSRAGAVRTIGPGALEAKVGAGLGTKGIVDPGGQRGDHDLNPGMTVPDKTRPAAVLVPIVAHDFGPTVLLTKRSEDLPVHAGQVSFPGGRVDPGDLDAVDTALRETEEEIGIERSSIDIAGRLDTYLTRTGYEVVPVVGLLEPPIRARPDPSEVAEVFEIPLSMVLDRRNHQRHSRVWQSVTRHFYVLPHDQHYIWGATAGMLVNLADRLLQDGGGHFGELGASPLDGVAG